MYFDHQTLYQLLQKTYLSKNAHPLHIAYVTLFISLYFFARSFVSLGQFSDKVFYPYYQKQPITKPILITGNPRSGTTFLHHLLANDPQFSSTKLYQTIFPAISFYRCFETIKRLTSRHRNRWNRWLEWLDKRSFGGWQSIHNTQLNGYEEDETVFVWSLLTPVITLLFPFPHQLPTATWVDQSPQETRDQLMTYYQDFLKRHLYATGTHKTLLIKNTTLTGRLTSMLETLPDMRVIHIIRHPYEAIPSLLSMYAVPWQKFCPQIRNQPHVHESLAQLYAEYYRRRIQIFQEMDQHKQSQLIEIRYEELMGDPYQTIEKIYAQFNLTMSPKVQHQLKQITQKPYQSTHHYSPEQFGLSRERLYEMMPDVFAFYGFDSLT